MSALQNSKLVMSRGYCLAACSVSIKQLWHRQCVLAHRVSGGSHIGVQMLYGDSIGQKWIWILCYVIEAACFALGQSSGLPGLQQTGTKHAIIEVQDTPNKNFVQKCLSERKF